MSWPIQHLRLRLRPIQRALRATVESRREQRGQLPLHMLDEMLATGRTRQQLAATEEEQAEEQHLRERATANGASLPIDEIARDYALEPFEIEAILVTALVELDRGYRSVISFIHDDAGRERPTTDLVAELTSTTLVERIAHRAQLGRLGRLRRLGFIRSADPSLELDADLAITPNAFDVICGRGASQFRDPLEIASAEWDLHDDRLAPLIDGMRSSLIGTIGLWGGAADARLDVARSLATALGRALRRPWQRAREPAKVRSARSSASSRPCCGTEREASFSR